ncbi:MAG: M15 family metallopeptidase [Prosthecobacter sp.]
MTLPEIIREVQAELKKTQPSLAVDGKAGPQTWGAIYDRIVGGAGTGALPAPGIQVDDTPVDARSEKNIATLHPRVQPLARSLILRAMERGWNFKITSALRTYAEQDALYAQDRTKPGKRVTNARGGYSNHNFGLAFDVTLFNGSQPVWDSPLYKALAVIGQELGLEWGGNWKSPVDEPHYQLRPAWAAGMKESVMLTELRRRKAAVRDFYA